MTGWCFIHSRAEISSPAMTFESYYLLPSVDVKSAHLLCKNVKLRAWRVKIRVFFDNSIPHMFGNDLYWFLKADKAEYHVISNHKSKRFNQTVIFVQGQTKWLKFALLLDISNKVVFRSFALFWNRDLQCCIFSFVSIRFHKTTFQSVPKFIVIVMRDCHVHIREKMCQITKQSLQMNQLKKKHLFFIVRRLDRASTNSNGWTDVVFTLWNVNCKKTFDIFNEIIINRHIVKSIIIEFTVVSLSFNYISIMFYLIRFQIPRTPRCLWNAFLPLCAFAFGHTAGTQMSWNFAFESRFSKPKFFLHVLSLTFAAALMIRGMTTTLNASESLKGLLVRRIVMFILRRASCGIIIFTGGKW